MSQVDVGRRYRERGPGRTIGGTIEIRGMDFGLAGFARVPERQISFAN
jgi:hypothetical protein